MKLRDLHSQRHRQRRAVAPVLIIAAVVPVLVVASLVVAGVRSTVTTTHTACTITEKEDRALASLDEREPRVYTDCGVFVVADEPFRFHFTAADIYNELTVGKTVNLTTVGWRVGALSWFPNIVEVSDPA